MGGLVTKNRQNWKPVADSRKERMMGLELIACTNNLLRNLSELWQPVGLFEKFLS